MEGSPGTRENKTSAQGQRIIQVSLPERPITEEEIEMLTDQFVSNLRAYALSSLSLPPPQLYPPRPRGVRDDVPGADWDNCSHQWRNSESCETNSELCVLKN